MRLIVEILMIFDKFSLHMKILIKQATIISPDSPHHLLGKDLLIEDGVVKAIEDNLDDEDAKLISEPNLHISIGWMDILADFADPGFEHRETIASGSQAAVNGGFTDVLLLPNTKPAADNKTQIEYIIQKACNSPINLHPIGAITKNCMGEELAEMYDMAHSGAIAFSDGTHSVKKENILIKALQYQLATGKTIIQIANASQFSNHGLMNEGVESTRLGLPGIPCIAEELMIGRDIELAKYTGGKLHIAAISSRKGLELAMKASEENDNISFSVAPTHLWFTDKNLQNYDTNFKLMPPLRSEEDKNFILQAAKNGKIPCFCSMHLPVHSDEKDCEFEYAAFGSIGLETVFASLLTAGVPLLQIISSLTSYPRKIFGLELPKIELNAAPALTLFNPTASRLYESRKGASLSANSPFNGMTLTGTVIGIINKGEFFNAK